MRKSELFNLLWSDIDFGQHKISIEPKKDWHTKNYKSRTVFMTPFLYETLREHQKAQIRDGVKSRYVFIYNGKKIKCSIAQALANAVERAGLKSEDSEKVTLRHV